MKITSVIPSLRNNSNIEVLLHKLSQDGFSITKNIEDGNTCIDLRRITHNGDLEHIRIHRKEYTLFESQNEKENINTIITIYYTRGEAVKNKTWRGFTI